METFLIRLKNQIFQKTKMFFKLHKNNKFLNEKNFLYLTEKKKIFVTYTSQKKSIFQTKNIFIPTLKSNLCPKCFILEVF